MMLVDLHSITKSYGHSTRYMCTTLYTAQCVMHNTGQGWVFARLPMYLGDAQKFNDFGVTRLEPECGRAVNLYQTISITKLQRNSLIFRKLESMNCKYRYVYIYDLAWWSVHGGNTSETGLMLELI